MDLLSQAVAAITTGRPRSYVIECRPPWGRRYGARVEAGVHVVLEGQATFITEDADPIVLGTGDVLLLPGGIGHGLASAADVPLLALDHQPPGPDEEIVIGPDGTAEEAPYARLLCGTYRTESVRRHPLLRRLPPVIHLPSQLGEQSELSAVVALLAGELTRRKPGSALAVESLLDLLLVTTLREAYRRDPDSGWAAALSDAPVAEALNRIHDDPRRSWTVAGLAAEVGLSRAALARRFSDSIGIGPLGYLTWWRMVLAARLLRDTDRVLADIARDVGYSSPYALAHAFKRQHGLSPGRYRDVRNAFDAAPPDDASAQVRVGFSGAHPTPERGAAPAGA